MIEITSETIERTQTLLAGIPKGAERAFSNAINRGLSHTKTQAFKQVKTVYAVKQSALNEATTTRVQKASTGNIAGYVSFSGVKIPLYKFQVTPKEPRKGQKVRAGVMKGGGATFDSAFIAKMKSGHIGVFERVTSKRLPIEEKMGLSAAQMVQNEDIIDKLTKEAQEIVDERLKHEIDRILNGYGG
jgi:hypothetical protein